MSALYSITHRDTGREYIGMTKRRVESRWADHVSVSRRAESAGDYNTRMPIVRALRRYGAEAFDFRVEATLPTAEEAKIAERIAIALRRPAFNASRGGDGNGNYIRTPETRLKISLSNARAWAEGRRSREVSSETRERMSAARSGRKHSAETRALIAEANRRRVVSEESRAKMSATRRGVKHGPMPAETRAKIAAKARARYAGNKETS
jgi:group I intron endonuclease